jgi:hypothetical protein
MFIAQEKYKTNISEYILYMFNIEDVIRANQFNLDLIEEKIIMSYHLPQAEHQKVKEWYHSIINQMVQQDLKETGHTAHLIELMAQLNDLHISLLNNLEEEQYQSYYRWARPIISELKSKMKSSELTEIEVCFYGLYGFLLLKLKQQNITSETSDAMSVFSQLLRFLSKRYHENMKNLN